MTLGSKLSGEIRRFSNGDCAAWGTVRVEVVVEGSHWRTSIFPDGARHSYLLPVKRDVRQALGIAKGNLIAGKLLLSTGNVGEL